MAVVPALKVEIAFVSAPLDIAPTWVDVSIYVRGGVTIRRGRQSELDNFDAGTATLTLSNRDRRFDPSYSAGPYFGNLSPRKQIRITATWSAVDYVMFTGWVTGWPQAFAAPAGMDATVTIQAIDALAWLSQTDLPTDLVYSYAHDTIGSLAFFLRGADTATWSDATSNGYYASVLRGTGRTTSALAPGMSSSAVSFDLATAWTPAKVYTSAGAWSMSFWMQSQQPSPGGYLICGGSVDEGDVASVDIEPSGVLRVKIANAAISTGPEFYSASPVNDGTAHHIVITSDGATIAGYHLYVDGHDVTTSLTGSVAVPLKVDVIGNVASGLGPYSGSLQDIAVFDKQLSTAEVIGLFQRSYGSMYESSSARVTRLLDDVGWPATWRTLCADDSTSLGHAQAIVGELVYNAANVNSKLQEVQASEQGRIFAGKDNKVTFLGRYYAQEVTAGNTIQQIFSDDGGATALPYSTFGFDPTDLDMTNQATVTTPTTYASSSDATSITNFGRQSKTVDTILTTFTDANTMAEGLVAQGKGVRYRTAPITAYPMKNTSRWDEVLSLELGHRISMEITPMKVGSQQVQELTLEQIEWEIADNTIWTLTVGGSPVFGTSTSAGWFIWGSSLVDGPDVIGY